MNILDQLIPETKMDLKSSSIIQLKPSLILDNQTLEYKKLFEFENWLFRYLLVLLVRGSTPRLLRVQPQDF
jgi:hypothetical protein